MKFIVIYTDLQSPTRRILKEQFDTHATALDFIEEVIEENPNLYEFDSLIHGAPLVYYNN